MWPENYIGREGGEIFYKIRENQNDSRSFGNANNVIIMILGWNWANWDF